MKDEGIDRAIRKTLAEGDVSEPGKCPDDSRIAAYFDSRLRPEENAEFEAHAARCTACREVLALSMRLGEETGEAQHALPRRDRKVLFHVAIPVSALALLVVASGIGILYYRTIRNTNKAPAEAQTADLRVSTSPRDTAPLSRAPEREALESSASPQQSKIKKGVPESQRGYPSKEFSPPVPEIAKDEVLAEAGKEAAMEQHGKLDAPVTLQAASTEMKAESAAAGGAPAAGRGTISEPRVSATRLHTPQTTATDTQPDAEGESRLKKSAASAESTPAGYGQEASRKPRSDRAGAPVTKRIGDRTFVRTPDMWVDNECEKHPDIPVVEILPDSEEYADILKSYPELRYFRPAMIFWKERKLLLR